MKHEKQAITKISVSLVMLVVILILNGAWTTQANDITAEPVTAQQGKEKGETPFQQALDKILTQRNHKNLPVPGSVAYSYDVKRRSGEQDKAGLPEEDILITATTILQFDHPKQAGLNKWPAPIIAGALPHRAVGSVTPGDYTNEVKDFLAQQFPGIWNQYAFGYEPRRFTLTEIYKITYPERPVQPNQLAPIIAPNSSTVEELVFGFTETGPGIEYIFEEEWEVCIPLLGCKTVAKIKAGLELDWDVGLRLPVAVNLFTPASMVISTTNTLTSTITPLNWSSDQYQQAGLEAANGNEFLLRFVIFLGVQAKIIGKNVIDWAIDGEYDASASFTTPFGPGTSFPLPPLQLPPDVTGLDWDIIPSILRAGLGLTINPSLTQSEITGAWQVMPDGDASGSGLLTYVDPKISANLTPIYTGDFNPNTDQARIQLMNFRYGFDSFLIEMGGYIEFELFGYGTEVGSFDIADFSLDDISDGPWLDIHDGTRDTIEHMIKVSPPSDNIIYLPLIKR